MNPFWRHDRSRRYLLAEGAVAASPANDDDARGPRRGLTMWARLLAHLRLNRRQREEWVLVALVYGTLLVAWSLKQAGLFDAAVRALFAGAG